MLKFLIKIFNIAVILGLLYAIFCVSLFLIANILSLRYDKQ